MKTLIRLFLQKQSDLGLSVGSATEGIYNLENFDVAINGPRREKTCLRKSANNKGADQPASPLRSKLATIVISIF